MAKPKPGAKSASKDLVKLGPREVFVEADKAQKLREVKPTTSRALVLRNGKYGIQSRSNLTLMSKISGREKLDLLAEDLIDRTNKAVAAPFDIEKCLRIAESQCDAYLGDISNLRDNEMFFNIISEECAAQARYDQKKTGQETDPGYIARIIATRVHNQYMMTSAWKIVRNTIRELIQRGMSNKNHKAVLRNDNKIRSLYLTLTHMVSLMVEINQQRFSVLALNSTHYAKYFKRRESEDPTTGPDIIFDYTELREAALSFIDSIVIELCFPQAPYPRFILYQILHDAAEESPKDTKRFSQLMWDAVGDLSECVELQQILEMPMLTSEAKDWVSEGPQSSPEFDQWTDAQMLSSKAIEEYNNFKDLVHPLTRSFKKIVLNQIWGKIDQNYLKVAGKNIDDLWQLKGSQETVAQWTSFYRVPENPVDSDEEDNKKVRRFKGKPAKEAKKPLAIANFAEAEFEDMPELQTVSNSSDEYSSEDDSVSEAEYLDSESDDSGYDTEEEAEIRELLREAMDVAHEKAWFSPIDFNAEIRKVSEVQDANPFLNLLGSLKGRLFQSNPQMKVPTASGKPRAKPSAKAPVAPSQKATVEEVTDEDEPHVSKKKKKKPKKKKKHSISTISEHDIHDNAVPSSPPPAPAPEPEVKRPQSPLTPTKQKKPPVAPAKARPAPPRISSAALPAFETATNVHGQSARTYLSSIEPHRVKPKTRSDQPSIFTKEEGNKPAASNTQDSELDAEEQHAARYSWFSRLPHKTANFMHQLLRTSDDVKQGKSGMRWDDFVKLMTEMGFDYDPSTAGSSVRFIPPGKDDHPITFHKPHPKPYVEAWLLRSFAKRLKKRYGWDEEAFMSGAESFVPEPEKED